MSDSVEVATSGTVPYHHKCGTCGRSMLYRSYDRRVCAMFCGNSQCAVWLHELPIAVEGR